MGTFLPSILSTCSLHLTDSRIRVIISQSISVYSRWILGVIDWNIMRKHWKSFTIKAVNDKYRTLSSFLNDSTVLLCQSVSLTVFLKVEVVGRNSRKSRFKFSSLFSVTQYIDECFRRKWEWTSVKVPISMQSALWAAESLKKKN